MNEMMNRLEVEPQDNEFYWWLPEFLKGKPENPNHWTIVHCSSSDPVGRVGVFIGPLIAPTYEILPE